MTPRDRVSHHGGADILLPCEASESRADKNVCPHRTPPRRQVSRPVAGSDDAADGSGVRTGDKVQGEPEKARPEGDRLRGSQTDVLHGLRSAGGADGVMVLGASAVPQRSTSCSPPFHATFAMPDAGWDNSRNCKSLTPSPSQVRVAGWRWRETNASSRTSQSPSFENSVAGTTQRPSGVNRPETQTSEPCDVADFLPGGHDFHAMGRPDGGGRDGNGPDQ